jgi:hypothetical protein
MEEDDDVMVTTTEPEHVHYCDVCGQIWSHADESCEGPRHGGGRPILSTPSFECPMCEEEEEDEL